MAKIVGMPIPQKAPSLIGNVVVSTWRGVAYVAKWPRKRSRPLPEHTKNQSEWFRQAGVLAKYLAPQQMQVAIEATRGTPLYPRDVLVMGMAGTLLSITMEDGRTLYSMSARQGVSDSLDILSQQDGAMLARSNGLWVPVYTPDAGKVLTSNGPNTAPSFQASGGGGGGRWTKIGELTAPASGLLELNGLSFSGYKHVQVKLGDIVPDTTGVHTGLRFEIGGSWIATGYKVGGQWVNDLVSASITQNSNTTAMWLQYWLGGAGVQKAAGESFTATIDFNALASSNFKSGTAIAGYQSTASGYVTYKFGYQLKNASAVTGIRLHPSAGAFASGSMSIWGMA